MNNDSDMVLTHSVSFLLPGFSMMFLRQLWVEDRDAPIQQTHVAVNDCQRELSEIHPLVDFVLLFCVLVF